jgi:hypothetical protein
VSAGLLMSGVLVDVPGLRIVPPASAGGPVWNALSPEDYRVRTTSWIRQIIPHTTGGHWPQPVLPGVGNGGHAKRILDMWAGRDRRGGDEVYSAAQITVDYDAVIYCSCDIVRTMAYHAEGSNAWSVGIEMCTLPDGSIYQGTIDATARLIAAMTFSGLPGSALLSIPFQMPRGPYRNAPIARMETGRGKRPPEGTRINTGGPSVVGVLGHRDNTSNRGRGDPGDALSTALAALGCEGIDYHGEEDLERGRERQAALNARGARLTVDGIVGPGTITAARQLGFTRMRDVA